MEKLPENLNKEKGKDFLNKTEEEIRVDAEKEIEQMPNKEREKIGLGLRNIGFFVQEQKSKLMAGICEKISPKESKSSIGRFFASLTETYRNDESVARRKIEEREESASVLKGMQNVGYLTSNIMKYGRTVADVVGWTAGSPLRYVMAGAQFFSRGAEAAKEARLKNEEVIEKTRVKDIDEAAEEAWKIYEVAKEKSGGKEISKADLEKVYAENLPQDLLKRLERSEPGMASGILSKISQKILKKDVEFAIKHGKFSESSFERRLKEFDKIIGHYGTVDALAMAAKYAETGGKAVVAGVQIESALLLIKKMPEIINSMVSFGVGEAGAIEAEIVIPEAKVALQPEAPVEKMIEYQGGGSIWQEAEKQLSVKFEDGFKNLSAGDLKTAEALKTYNIDRIKDTVVDAIKSGNKDLIEKYGLTGISDPDKLTVDQLKSIKWNNVFDDTLKEKGLVESLSSEQVESIVKNNATLKKFFNEHPSAPKTSKNYENILRGKGNTGIVPEAEEVKPMTKLGERLLSPEKYVTPGDLGASYYVGFDQVFTGGQVAKGVENIFGSDIIKEGVTSILIRSDGVKVIKNAFGQKGYDLLLTSKTIGVDGPAGWNWGSKGGFFGFGDRIPAKNLSPGATKEAKNFIFESVKKFSESFEKTPGR